MGTASSLDNQDGALEITVSGEKYRCLRFSKAKKWFSQLLCGVSLLPIDGVKIHCCNDILNASEYQEVRRTKEFLLFNRSTLKSSWEVTKQRFRFERFVTQSMCHFQWQVYYYADTHFTHVHSVVWAKCPYLFFSLAVRVQDKELPDLVGRHCSWIQNVLSWSQVLLLNRDTHT